MSNVPFTPDSSGSGDTNISRLLLALLDLLSVTVITYATVVHFSEYNLFTERYAILLLSLLGAMAFFYSQFGVYYAQGTFARHLSTLTKGWVFSFGALLVVKFALGETEVFSRLALATLFFTGLGAQITLHTSFRLLSHQLKTQEAATPTLISGHRAAQQRDLSTSGSQPVGHESDRRCCHRLGGR
jgi:FlaA1/EpsC-like NDP-sugar epimerase